VSTEIARIPYVGRCVLRRAGERVDAVICSLSLTGAYVTFLRALKTAMPEVDEALEISFPLPGDVTLVEAEVLVSWRNLEERHTIDGLPMGCGLLFTSLRPQDHRRIDELIDDYREAPQPRISAPPPRSGFRRMPYVEPCVIVGDSATWEGVICNLSVLGVYVTLDPIPPPDLRLRIYFRTPDRPDPLEAACEVAWVNDDGLPHPSRLPPGCGLRFLDLDDASRAELELLAVEYDSLPRT
jgi:hypothetical protein